VKLIALTSVRKKWSHAKMNALMSILRSQIYLMGIQILILIKKERNVIKRAWKYSSDPAKETA
jgi:hypothetical protein